MSNKLCWCLPINCDVCYTYIIPYCPPTLINIPTTNLTYNSTYYLWIRDKFGNVWTDTVLGLSDGTFNINQANFPTGMWTEDFGPIDIYLSTDNLGTIVKPLQLYGYSPYNCLILSVAGPIYLMDDSGCIYLTDDDGNLLIV
jgi:hypothetical protein